MLSLVAGAAAAVTFAVVPGSRVPGSLLAVTAGGEPRRIDVEGGLELEIGHAPDVEPALLDRVAENLRRRVEARGVEAEMRRAPGRLLVEVPGVGEEDRDRFRDLVRTAGKLEFEMVEPGTGEMAALYQLAKDDPRAAELGVRGEADYWRHEETGRQFEDFYLRADSREALETYLDELARRDPKPAVDYDALAIEEVEPSPDRPGYARTYYLDRRVLLDSMDIADARVQLDEWRRPIVMVEFTREGARRFAELTRQHLGDKLAILIDGRVMSAPVIQTEIAGGRAQITMGAGDPRDMQRDAENTAGALRAGELPIPLDLVGMRHREPSVSTTALLAARGLFALAVGLLVLLALRLGRRLTGPVEEAGEDGVPRAIDRGRGWSRIAELPWRRLVVTVAALVAVVLAGRVALPSPEGRFDQLLGPMPGVLSLGLGPVLTGFLLVELVALAVPRWRPLRHGGPAGRARLGVATALVSLALAGFQGWMVATWQRQLVGPLAGPGDTAVIAVTLAAGVFALVALAWVVDRFGLGNGYSVLLLLGLYDAGRGIAARTRQIEVAPIQSLVGGVALAVLVVLTLWLLRNRRAASGRGLRRPTSGVVPLAVLGALLAVAEAVMLMGLSLPRGYWDLLAYLVPSQGGAFAVDLLVVVVGALALSWLFSRPALWARERGRLLGDPAREPAPEVARADFARATLATTLYLVAAVTLYFLINWKIPIFYFPLPVVLVSTAIGVDLVAEWRALATHPDLVAVWPLHRVPIADDVVRALAAQGIPAHLRGVHHRSMLHFFAPYVPIMVMVPRTMAGSARRLLAERLDPAATGHSSTDQERP